MPRCIVKNCPHWTGRKGSEGVILHGFPNDTQKIKTWLLHIKQDFGNIDEFAQKVLEGKKNDLYRICSLHFTSDCYEKRKTKTFLKNGAVPTVFQDIDTSVDPVICPPSKRQRTEDFVVEASAPSRIQLPIMRDSQTQTDTWIQTVTGTSKDVACMTNPKLISKSSGTQIELKYITSNCSIQCELLLPIPETTIQEKACVVQMDHFYPKSFSTPLKIGQESVSDQEFQKEYSINTDDLSQNRSEPMSFSCLDSTIESTEQGKDDDFEPLTEFENTETTFEEEEEKNEKDLIKERKFLVFESCLDDLLFKVRCGFSIECTSPIEKLNKKTIGSSLSVTATCISGHEFQLWQSQPRIRNVPAGNLLLSCAILCSGASFQKVDDMLNILGLLHISKTTYYRFQREYLFQAIDRQWQLEQESLRTQLSEKALCVAGDGQYDSPGHCAKYCIYSMMDMVSEKILHFQILQIFKKKRSGELEKEAFCKCLKKIQEDGFDVQIVATDRHSGIKKAVQDDFKTLIHQFDTWHFTKSLRKKLVAASKRRLCKPLSEWIQPLVNHFWWSAQTCGGDVDVLKEKWNSALNHIQGIHEWEDGLGGCAHDTLTEEEENETQWIKNRIQLMKACLPYSTILDLTKI
ncbi:uncharacterized protein LOC121395106 [Xenopus laevis]|uniref:Uncharacterized protein LOC121395106 n=1 Tax=Xenopus laevis TaxID=8355 RepID=A0A8J1L250_XENLA|nr:uncharacterized protein LOC121395106 [Xenopus laevis]